MLRIIDKLWQLQSGWSFNCAIFADGDLASYFRKMKQKKIQNSQQILRRRHGKGPNLLVLLLILTVRVSFFVCLGLSKRIREPQLIQNPKDLEMDWIAWKEEYLEFEMETQECMGILLEDRTLGVIGDLLLERDTVPLDNFLGNLLVWKGLQRGEWRPPLAPGFWAHGGQGVLDDQVGKA